MLICISCGGSADLSFYRKHFPMLDLAEFSLKQSDNLNSPGGNWSSLRYERKSGTRLDRKTIVSRIRDSYLKDGWRESSPPSEKYVLSKIYETGKTDLYFSRKYREGEPEQWFFNLAAHVDENAEIVCVYAEMGR